jgi:hypothetical protein
MVKKVGVYEIGQALGEGSSGKGLPSIPRLARCRRGGLSRCIAPHYMWYAKLRGPGGS